MHAPAPRRKHGQADSSFVGNLQTVGLSDDPVEIDRFITTHSPLEDDVKLVDAPFWSDSQRAFLKEKYIADDDWIR
uniref:DUF2789 domain-containing protein n=1 Tax=Ditylenchus dipsaci TaxID=166011 RepID=A0A915DRX6_9BILA